MECSSNPCSAPRQCIDEIGRHACVRNVAYGKQSKQSSDMHSYTSADKAVDGNRNSNLDSRFCASTTDSDQPWWEVDLGQSFLIAGIQITNRDTHLERLRDFDVFVDSNLCFHFANSFGSGTSYFPCKSFVKGQKVKVKLKGHNVLTLCEVDVIASKEGIAVNKTATQSSLFGHGAAWKAVDGSYGESYDKEQCTHTDEGLSWWQVDLAKQHIIAAVQITNRDVLSERLSNFTVMVDSQICHNFTSTAGTGKTYLPCSRPLQGQTVKIQRLCFAITIAVYTHATISRLPCDIFAEFRIFSIGKRLTGHVLRTDKGLEDGQCMMKCVEHRKCRSYNLNVEEKLATAVVGATCKKLNPCKAGVLCKDKCEPPFYECIMNCSENESGSHCKARPNADNQCSSHPCTNGGGCIDVITGYKCNCIEGYTGKNCEHDIDECTSLPCFHGGKCINQVNNFSCNCLPGYLGRHCETGIVRGKTTSQSSTSFASKASPNGVDGVVNTCIETNVEAKSWWKVDLGGDYYIAGVQIRQKSDCCWLSNFKVKVESDVCSEFTGTSYNETIYIPCDSSLRGKNIKIEALEAASLTICELDIINVRKDIAKDKFANQSSLFGHGYASLAVDGKYGQSYSKNECSHTENAAKDWLQVDLGTVHIVAAVYILNRDDCCSERLKEFYVFVDDKV
eukprot:gene7212-12892_t